VLSTPPPSVICFDLTPYSPPPWLGALPSYRVFGILFLNILHPRSLTRSCTSDFIPLLEIANCAAKDHPIVSASGKLEEQKLQVTLEVLSRIATTLFSSAPCICSPNAVRCFIAYMRGKFRSFEDYGAVCVVRVCVCVRVCACVCVCVGEASS